MSFNFKNTFQALIPLKPIIMLSHMRANTSLFGHILGSNPEINGYYEMHISYYSWKSFFRQKLKYLENHQFKKNSHYIFDKSLHNEHYINCNLLKNKKAKIIISLRSPEETIPSIIRLYRDTVDPSHEFSNFTGAVNYYKKRLEQLVHYAETLKNNFIYLDANSIKNDTENTFSLIENYLNLKTPLSTNYNLQELTGVGSSGDHSETLKQGKIIKTKPDYSDIEMNDEVLLELNKLYLNARKKIIAQSRN